MPAESSHPPFFSDEMIANRFDGSPFAENYIELVTSEIKPPSFYDKINFWSSYYQPGFISGVMVFMGVVQRDLSLIGTGISSFNAEGGIQLPLSVYTNDSTSA